MLNDNYITVKEYSERYNIPMSDVFSMIFRNELTHKDVGGSTYVLVDISSNDIAKSDNNTAVLLQEIERLNNIIIEKDKIIADKDKQISDFAMRFSDMAIQAQTIATQAQVLQATTTVRKQGFFSRLLNKKSE